MSFRPPSSAARRPGSGFRPGSSAYNRPMTGFRRLDTANGQAPASGESVGLATDVTVQARPLTQHGITGMATSNQSKRKVADRTYYENQLKQKLSEIINEISILQKKIHINNVNKDQIGQLEKDRNILMNEVRELEGQLADYNLALDKMRSGANINELTEACNEIKQRNDREKHNLDAVYLEKKRIEEEIETNLKEITELHNSIESHLNQNNGQNLETNASSDSAMSTITQADPDANNENQNENGLSDISKQYRQLLKETRDIDLLYSEKEKQLSEIQHKYNNIRTQLHASEKYSNNLKAMHYQKQISSLNTRKKELTSELNDSGSMDSEAIKRNILERVKKDNAILNETKHELNKMEVRIEEYNLTLVQKERDLETMKHNASQAHKFEKLYETDKKMNQFISQFKDNMEELQIKKKEYESNIVGLMQHISMENASKEERMKKFNKLSNDLSLKLTQKQQSEQTLAHIIKEKEEASKYLERIENLDKKIPSEIEKLASDRIAMEKEISEFKTSDEIQEHFKLEKIRLFKQKMSFQQEKEEMEKKVSDISLKLDEMNEKLHSNAYHTQLQELEQKIVKLSANIFTVEENINEHKREGNYQPILQNVLKLSTKINKLLLKQVAMDTQM